MVCTAIWETESEMMILIESQKNPEKNQRNLCADEWQVTAYDSALAYEQSTAVCFVSSVRVLFIGCAAFFPIDHGGG